MEDKPILQEHNFGCGVACVAYALNLTYQQALRLFESPESAWIKGYFCRDLVAALAEAGAEYKYFYFRPKHRKFLRKPRVIVYTRRSPKYSVGHYLARAHADDAWMNPWSNYPVIYPLKGEMQKRLIGSVSYILIPTKYLAKEAK